MQHVIELRLVAMGVVAAASFVCQLGLLGAKVRVVGPRPVCSALLLQTLG